MLTGAVSALPGASGATMLVIFGRYERLIGGISSVRRAVSDARFLAVILTGIIAGMLACSVGLDYVIENWKMPAMFFFAMLILCQIPDVKSIEGRTEPANGVWWAMFAVGLVVIAGLFAIRGEGSLEPNALLMALVGAIFAIAKVLPGISGSTVLVAIGLYDPFLDAIASFNLGYLVPILIGAAIAVVLFSKTMTRCMEEHRTGAFGLIMGLTVGSMLTVSAEACMSVGGTGDIAPAVAGIVVGLAAGCGLRALAKRFREKD